MTFPYHFTHLVGYIECDYQTLVDCFGEPNSEDCDGYKTDAEWRVAENSLRYAISIYNWKNGKNYCGPDGLAVEDITRWNIGGKNSSDVSLIEQVLGTGKNEMDEVESIIHQMVEDSDVPVESVAYIIIGDDE